MDPPSNMHRVKTMLTPVTPGVLLHIGGHLT